MAHHEVVDNNPVKELLFAVAGVGLFLVLVLGIVVSAYLRPAGDHYPSVSAEATAVQTAEAETAIAKESTDSATATAETVVNEVSDSVAPAQNENAGEQVAPVTSTNATDGDSVPAEQTDGTTPPANN